jgi:flagellar hook-associated protein 3 FlgL
MRVATQSLFRGIQQNILRLSYELKKIEEKVSSGKNFNRPSDNPVAVVNSLGLRSTLARIEQYQKNMDTGKVWLDMNETVLEQVSKLAARAQEIALQLSSGSQTAEVRAAAMSEIDQLLDEAIGLGNTQLNGKYIFGGYRTDMAPFAHSVSGGVESVVYQGDGNDFQVQIGPGETITAGKNGETVFMDSDLFAGLMDLKQAIANNDQTAIEQQSAILQGATDYFNAQVSDVGIRQSRLKIKGEIFSQFNLQLQNQVDDLENVDYNRAIMELKEKQTAYEVALETAAKISQVNLLSYL